MKAQGVRVRRKVKNHWHKQIFKCKHTFGIISSATICVKFTSLSSFRAQWLIRNHLTMHLFRSFFAFFLQRQSPDVKAALFSLLYRLLLRKHRYFFPSPVIASLLTDGSANFAKSVTVAHKADFLAILTVNLRRVRDNWVGPSTLPALVWVKNSRVDLRGEIWFGCKNNLFVAVLYATHVFA